jgi:2-polyprenyl-3-methyl-5-hydroxy-6-metoxy-1,4-benzoquinol methylase
MSTVHHSLCPVCGSAEIKPLLTVKDHSVSGESFVIWQCSNCTLRFTQDTPDEASIAPYYQSPDYISHSNTRKGLVNQLYQEVRNYTLNQKARLIDRSTQEKGRVLDLGAGTGAFLNTMKNKGWQTIGLEPDAGARAQAEELYGLQLGELHDMDRLTDNSFDAVTLWHVLEHVHGLHQSLDKISSLLRDEGKLFIAVPNYESLDSNAYRLYWAAYDVPRHLYHFTPKSMDVLMRRHGFRIIAKKRMWFDSFYISLLSSKYKNGHTRWLGAFFNGLKSDIKALGNKDACSSIVYVIEKDRQRSN